MTTPRENAHLPGTPSGFVGRRQAEAMQAIADAQHAALQALPVRIFWPEDEAATQGVVAHFDYAPEGESWSVFGDVKRGSKGLVISRLEIRPAEASSGVTGSLLRKIPVGEILGAIRTKAAWEAAQREGTRAVLGQEPVSGVFDKGDEKSPRRGGRAPITDQLLREVALAYLEETAPGSPPGGMQRMAERFGRPEETIRTWVTRARKAGWLGPSAKGRAGAEPGPRLLSWARHPMGSASGARDARIASLPPAAQKLVRDQDLQFDVEHGIYAALAAINNDAEQRVAALLGVSANAVCLAAADQWHTSLTNERDERLRASPDLHEDDVHRQLADEIRADALDRQGKLDELEAHRARGDKR